VDGAGDYLLVAADPASGASTADRVPRRLGGSGMAGVSREKPGRVELAWDKGEIPPGETARLQVRAPFAGPRAADRWKPTACAKRAGSRWKRTPRNSKYP
jgi:uncharacterized protein YfaS (alpha-2-macroglobulin family)